METWFITTSIPLPCQDDLAKEGNKRGEVFPMPHSSHGNMGWLQRSPLEEVCLVLCLHRTAFHFSRNYVTLWLTYWESIFPTGYAHLPIYSGSRSLPVSQIPLRGSLGKPVTRLGVPRDTDTADTSTSRHHKRHSSSNRAIHTYKNQENQEQNHKTHIVLFTTPTFAHTTNRLLFLKHPSDRSI